MSTEVDDAHISVRFKHGIHTIFLFVDALAPFSSITEELINVLRERYPDGLIQSNSSSDKTAIPASPNIVYGVLKVPNDATKGWKVLKPGEREEYTPTKVGLRENSTVAFAFAEDDGDDVEFLVEWAEEAEELYDQES